MVGAKVVIQHALSTGRWHPALYRLAPLPGPGPHTATRYKSYGHHTTGFLTEHEARESKPLADLLADVGSSNAGAVEVRHLAAAGPDIIIESAGAIS